MDVSIAELIGRVFIGKQTLALLTHSVNTGREEIKSCFIPWLKLNMAISSNQNNACIVIAVMHDSLVINVISLITSATG